MSGRSAYGLDSGPEDWRVAGACAQGNWPWDWWTDESWTGRGHAIWVCENECPVKDVCLAWARAHPDRAGRAVYGGVFWTRARSGSDEPFGTVRPSTYNPCIPPPGRTPKPVPVRTGGMGRPPKLAGYAEEIRQMRAAGLSYLAISRRFGVSVQTVRRLAVAEGFAEPGGLLPCGTPGAAARHRVRGEPLDEECLQAVRDYERERKRDSRHPRCADPSASVRSPDLVGEVA